jgi:hypothetical protein
VSNTINSAKRLLEDLQVHNLTHDTRLRFPYLYLRVVSEDFQGRGDDDRRARLAQQIEWTPETLDATLLAANLELELLTPAESAEAPDLGERGHGWLRELVADIAPHAIAPIEPREPILQTLHFYGYKGGQARSTCLGYLARALADDNWRVLILDCDVEAPSLDILFEQRELSHANTLLGVDAGVEPRPRRVYDPDVGSGHVDLIACRPEGPEYALESIALSMGFGMDPVRLAGTLQRVAQHAKGASYHLLLIDHRAGISPFVIPAMEALPGHLVLFARLDEQWRAARAYLPALLRRSLDRSGVVVAFRGDGEAPEQFLTRNQTQIEDLLTILARVKNEGEPAAGTELAAGDLRPNLLIWPFDAAFRESRLPESRRTSGELRDVIYELRRLTVIEGRPRETGLRKSGAQDRGDFVQTSLWRELLRPDVSLRYIFGRKGTGKTRLLAEMQRRKFGEPLLVDRLDQSSWGLQASSSVLNAAIERYSLDPGAMFWMLFGCALGLQETSRVGLEAAVHTSLSHGTDRTLNMRRLYENARGKSRRTFLIDGLETAFPTDKLSLFIEHLFRTLWEFQSDRALAGVIEFRVFLRTDLAGFGIQNREQQLEGQEAYLRWDYQSILNFALLRMLATEPEPMRFYSQTMPEAIKEIEQERERLAHGALSIEECEGLLLRIFPQRIPRNNLLTTNFLRTYFTDTDTPILSLSNASSERGATYYPRVFDAFLAAVGKSAQARGSAALIDGRVDPSILISAHEVAAEQFLDQVRQELDFQVSLFKDEQENRDNIGRLLMAFGGEATPFVPADLAERIATKLGSNELNPSRIKRALEQMRDVGIFESRPGSPSEWRVGRLFKSSLRMRYQR